MQTLSPELPFSPTGLSLGCIPPPLPYSYFSPSCSCVHLQSCSLVSNEFPSFAIAARVPTCM